LIMKVIKYYVFVDIVMTEGKNNSVLSLK